MRIILPRPWIEAVEKWRQVNGVNQEDLGRMAAAAIGSPKPFHVTTISRFLQGRTTLELADAVAKATGIPLPEEVGRIPHVPVEDELWLQAGRELRALNPRLFQEELADLLSLVRGLERRRDRRKDNGNEGHDINHQGEGSQGHS